MDLFARRVISWSLPANADTTLLQSENRVAGDGWLRRQEETYRNPE
ncbi:TPA: hypothetical protein N2F43_004576 [Salmonella enterica]|nr:hypothetical protein [Salmonella enterica]